MEYCQTQKRPTTICVCVQLLQAFGHFALKKRFFWWNQNSRSWFASTRAYCLPTTPMHVHNDWWEASRKIGTGGGWDGVLEGGRKENQEGREGGRYGGREEGREVEREAGRKGGREEKKGGKEGWRKGRRDIKREGGIGRVQEKTKDKEKHKSGRAR